MDENPQNVHPFPRGGHLTPVPSSSAVPPKEPAPPKLVSAQRFGEHVVFVFDVSKGQDVIAFEPSQVMFMQQTQLPLDGDKGAFFSGSILTLKSGGGGLIQIAFHIPPLEFIQVCVHLGIMPPSEAIWKPPSDAPSEKVP